MNTDGLTTQSYLAELYRLSGGDTELQVSMYEVGAGIGLEKSEAGSIAENLMVQGQAELRTLAGGISITTDGLSSLGVAAAPSPQSQETNFHLSKGPVANETDCEVILNIIKEIKSEISSYHLEYLLLEEIVIDLKTIEVHLLSPKPKIAILLEILRSLQDTLGTAKMEKAAAILSALTV
jgi:hypothetical protein